MRWLILSVFVALSFLHFFKLQTVPIGIQPDELEFVLSGYTYRHYGVDLAGYGLPLSLFVTHTHGVISPVPALVYALVFLFVEPSQLIVRLVPTLLMMGTVYWIYALCRTLFKRRDVAIVAASVFLMTPWQFHYARYAADTPFALFFVMGAISFLLKDKVKYWWIGLGLLILGFFSYHGAKLLYAPIVIACVVYHLKLRTYHKQFNELKRPLFTVFMVSMVLFLAYLVVLFSLKESIVAQRGEQLFFLNHERMNYEVDYARQRAFPAWLNSLLINKVTYGMSVFVANYFTSFSPDVLLVAGDPSSINRWDGHGLLYRTDILVLLLGLVWLWMKYPRKGLLLAILVAAAPLPSALSNFNASVIHRSFLLVGLLPIVLACGYIYVYELLQKFVEDDLLRQAFLSIIAMVMAGQIVYFLHFYFYRFPLLHPDAYYLGERLVAAYLDHGKKNVAESTYFIADNEPRTVALTYLFYADAQTRRAHLIPGHFPEGTRDVSFGEFTFRAGCKDDDEGVQIIDHDFGHCRDRESGFVQILSPKDGGSYYRIYGDQLCDSASLQPFTFPYRHADMSYYPLLADTFCERWISR